MSADLLAAFDALLDHAAEVRAMACRYGEPDAGRSRRGGDHQARPADRRLHAI